MKQSQLGSSELQVSALCLGTMNFGPRTSEANSFAIMSRALEAGINFFDTANQYGGDLGVGTTEEIIGRWLAQDTSRRSKIVLATKVYEPMSDDPMNRGLSARHVVSACEASLKRLGSDHIDLYQMHHIDRTVPIDETLEAMARLIEQGKISHVGSSNFPGWAIARANEKAGLADRSRLVSEQSLYNLIERRIELEVLPACAEYGLGLIPWSPLAGGMLAGPSASKDGRRMSAEQTQARAKHSERLSTFEALCLQMGESPAAVALAWLLHQPGVVSTIIGPASVEQLDGMLHVPEIDLSDETLTALDAIFPAQGRAPEAYAW